MTAQSNLHRNTTRYYSVSSVILIVQQAASTVAAVIAALTNLTITVCGSITVLDSKTIFRFLRAL